jgi:hypothetical protein
MEPHHTIHQQPRYEKIFKFDDVISCALNSTSWNYHRRQSFLKKTDAEYGDFMYNFYA